MEISWIPSPVFQGTSLLALLAFLALLSFPLLFLLLPSSLLVYFPSPSLFSIYVYLSLSLNIQPYSAAELTESVGHSCWESALQEIQWSHVSGAPEVFEVKLASMSKSQSEIQLHHASKERVNDNGGGGQPSPIKYYQPSSSRFPVSAKDLQVCHQRKHNFANNSMWLRNRAHFVRMNIEIYEFPAAFVFCVAHS